MAENKKKTIIAPQELKTTERRFGEVIEDMIQLITRIYRNQVLEELHKSTINKFADAQPGNYARVLERLSNKASKKLIDRFDDKRIERMITKFYNDTNKRNADELYGKMEETLGIDAKRLLRKEGLTVKNNALIRESINWVERLRDETLKNYTANTIREMSLGKNMDEIINKYVDLSAKSRDRAKFTARQQIGTYNSLLTKMRSQKVGIKKAIWRTSKDERVRRCHEVRNGQEFDLNEGLYSSCDRQALLPGEDWQCRCTYELIIPDETEE